MLITNLGQELNRNRNQSSLSRHTTWFYQNVTWKANNGEASSTGVELFISEWLLLIKCIIRDPRNVLNATKLLHHTKINCGFVNAPKNSFVYIKMLSCGKT